MEIMNEIIRIIKFMIGQIIHVWPLLAITVPIAVYLRVSKISQNIGRIFNNNIHKSILLATLVGGMSPFCSCSVIPIISSLLIGGVPIAPVMAFWLASPSMDPEIFFLSIGTLGWNLAVARLLATFAMSYLSAYIVHFLIKRGFIDNKNVLKEKPNIMGFNFKLFFMKLLKIKPKKKLPKFAQFGEMTKEEMEKEKKRMERKVLINNIMDSFMFIFKFMLIAYFLEALIKFYVPESLIRELIGSKSWTTVFMATLVGLPLYTTNLSALGILSGLLEKGMNPGAALAFLISGATTTIPAMAAVFGLVKKRVFFLYVSFAMLWALIAGLIYNLIF